MQTSGVTHYELCTKIYAGTSIQLIPRLGRSYTQANEALAQVNFL